MNKYGGIRNLLRDVDFKYIEDPIRIIWSKSVIQNVQKIVDLVATIPYNNFRYDGDIYFEILKTKVQDEEEEDPNKEYKEVKDWIRKGNRMYLVQPDEFSYLEESLPKQIKELFNLYNSVTNKCIVTARPESVRNKIELVLKQFGFKNPKWGLHMRPDGRINAGQWKGEKIVELAKSTGFQNVIFYDDNSKYIRGAKKVVSQKLPNLNFKCVKV